MKNREFKASVRALLDGELKSLTADEIVLSVRQELVDFQREQAFPEPNKGKPWTDEQLRIVLSYAPTEENTVLLARAFGRGYGSIEQIFRWAGQSEKRIDEERSANAFVQQVLRVRKQLRWRSVGGDK